MTGYSYIAHNVAPNTIEFYCRTPQGHRVVRIYLGTPSNPRVVAFNEINFKRSPAELFMSELSDLLSQAKVILGVKTKCDLTQRQ